MKKREYLYLLNGLKSKYEAKVQELQEQFVKENNPYEVGDKVKDSTGWILITDIDGFTIDIGDDFPQAIITGFILKKGKKKTKKKRTIYQNNIIKVK